MDLSELEDIHDKISYHCSELENNLEILDSLVTSIQGDAYFVEELRQTLRTAFFDLEKKYEEEKSEILRGE
jgi:prefoldin subunit 5